MLAKPAREINDSSDGYETTRKITSLSAGIVSLGLERSGSRKQGALSIDAAGVQESTEVALNILEALVVAVSEPRLNLQRGRWGKATQYYQWWQNIEEEEADD
ncbi:hypothetical protein [uncultured Lamprocystis sp.]|jgi:hypothetical protein|uniref:hypothetical protein n=1 Tax=uncultured Lamprocystis sp. TaxID=543132 RepID=UPI0025FB36DF|nr:hypothetical protein [uncultured Lamprocystis sp.]